MTVTKDEIKSKKPKYTIWIMKNKKNNNIAQISALLSSTGLIIESVDYFNTDLVPKYIIEMINTGYDVEDAFTSWMLSRIPEIESGPKGDEQIIKMLDLNEIALLSGRLDAHKPLIAALNYFTVEYDDYYMCPQNPITAYFGIYEPGFTNLYILHPIIL